MVKYNLLIHFNSVLKNIPRIAHTAKIREDSLDEVQTHNLPWFTWCSL